jgi:phosphoribosylaminoimidazolecarboxamide formyltransferase/IMP cyclohydrolase
LVSVYDKSGLVELAQALHAAGVELVSTGSTAATIAGAGVPVTQVSDLTGFPECLDGRVKTLHPKVHAGILADLRLDAHREQLAELGVEPFDLVVVNLYPFTQTVSSGATPDECVEQIDIGGPSMVRAAAKNHPSVAVVVDPSRYADVAAAVAAGGFDLEQRKRLAAEAFAHTAAYDVAVAAWFSSEYAPSDDEAFPAFVGGTFGRVDVLRYGENPHQPAALYRAAAGAPGIAHAEQLHGKEMSYNNYVDADAARRAAYDHAEPAVAIIKHANPCGIAIGTDIAQAHARANDCDPVSAFGGVIAANRPITAAGAEQISAIFTEVVIAPDFAPGVLELLTRKKDRRLIRQAVNLRTMRDQDIRSVAGGFLVQDPDQHRIHTEDLRVVTKRRPTDEEMEGLLFAWNVSKHVKSNAIVYVRRTRTLGVGAGQMSRVDSSRIAAQKAAAAGFDLGGCVVASDAFFPFPDGLLEAVKVGASAVIQPGGSVRDGEVIEAADANGVAMVFTGIRHFRH